MAVGQVDKITQSNAANAEESAAAAQELNAQAEMMKQSINELSALVSGKGSADRGEAGSAAVAAVNYDDRTALGAQNESLFRKADPTRRLGHARQNGLG
jgi:hypothetical protein